MNGGKQGARSRTTDGNATAADIIDSLESSWNEVLELARAGRLNEAQALLKERRSAAQVGKIRGAFDAFLTDWNSHFALHETRIEIGKLFVLLSQILIGAMMVFAFRSAARDAGRGRPPSRRWRPLTSRSNTCLG